MTPTEIRDRCKTMAETVGKKGRVAVTINVEDYATKEPLTASLYTMWPARYEPDVAVHGSDWTTLFVDLQLKWDGFQTEYRARVTQEMGLEIIRMTAERGSCTDGNLRVKFRPEDVKNLGAAACAAADKMASNGPFTIATTSGANARGNDGGDE